MEYISTRNPDTKVSFCQAVKHGLAPDGGLYIPSQLPDLKPYLEAWETLSYSELCKAFFELFATDIPKKTQVSQYFRPLLTQRSSYPRSRKIIQKCFAGKKNQVRSSS